VVRALLFFLLVPAAFGQPSLLVNNAAYRFGIQPPRLAPRSLVQVSLEISWADYLIGNPVPVPEIDSSQPLTLTVQAASGPEVPVAILTATWREVIALLPATLPLGPATMTLSYNGGLRSSGAVDLVPSAFALFTTSSWRGPALAQNVHPGSPVELNALTRPARPGSYLTLWGTGLGLASQQDVSVFLGGHPVPVQYVGPSPAIDGLDQVNIFVPFHDEIANGCYVPLRIDVLGEQGEPVSISKAAEPGPCAHPLGLSEQQMQRLDDCGAVGMVSVAIYGSVGPAPVLVGSNPAMFDPDAFTRNEQVFVYTRLADATEIARWSRPDDVAVPGCRTSDLTVGAIGTFIDVRGINLGDNVKVSGPEGRSLDLPRFGFGYYRAFFAEAPPVEDPADLPPPFFSAGEWEISAPGSADAEAFRIPVSLPPPVEVTNYGQLKTIEHGAGVTVTWNPEGYRESDTVFLQIQGTPSATESGAPSRPLLIECNVPARAGQVAVPTELLQGFESSGLSTAARLTLSLNGPQGATSRFKVKLTTGEVIPGFSSYSLSGYFPITFE
jgi:uncharacterized protein (TIGR03437 family)